MPAITSADEDAFALASDALADLDLRAFVIQESGDAVTPEDVVAAILAAAIPRIREDERHRCLQAARAVPAPLGSVYNAGFQAGHAAAKDAITFAIESLPVSSPSTVRNADSGAHWSKRQHAAGGSAFRCESSPTMVTIAA
jgi:hypothetical protein